MRKRNLIITAVVAWALLLVGLAYVSYRNDPPTVPGQTTVGQARETIDRVATEVVAAAPQQNAEIGANVERDCEISLARDGRSITRTVTLTATAGTEGDLLRSVAAKLDRYEPVIATPDDAVSMYADAGNFVVLRGRTEPGKVTFTMTSGCRES